MNPNVRAHELINVSESLIHVMTQEIELLKSGKVSEIAPLQEQKESLSGIYAAHIKQAAAEPGTFADVEPDTRVELEQIAVKFQKTAMENANAVRAALDMNAKLVQVIADAVIRSGPAASGYTKTGATPGGYSRNSVPPRPASLNRSL
jgi:flagellar biosynthesis/type III secretory pathway chaperone